MLSSSRLGRIAGKDLRARLWGAATRCRENPLKRIKHARYPLVTAANNVTKYEKAISTWDNDNSRRGHESRARS
jgi:hypothetical protein